MEETKLDSLIVLLSLLDSAVVAVKVKVPITICCTIAVITLVNSIWLNYITDKRQ